MHERYFDCRSTDNGRQQLRRRKMLLYVLLSSILLFSLILPVSIAEAKVGLTIETGDLYERALPDTVTAGQEFEVTVTFTAPADGFHAIGLTYVAPVGWEVNVDVVLTDPPAILAHTKEPEMAAYIWMGPFAEGAEFTAVYEVKVPVDARPGTYTFSGSLEYYIEPYPAPSYVEAISGSIQVDVAVATIIRIAGVTREVDGAILPGAAVILYRNGEAIANVVSDENGNYEFEFIGPGDYEVVASKAGFRDEARTISVTESTTYTLDFFGDHGLIPGAPSRAYVLACTDLWKLDEPSLQLSTSRLLDVISASKYPSG